jgi:hypothetical protein
MLAREKIVLRLKLEACLLQFSGDLFRREPEFFRRP